MLGARIEVGDQVAHLRQPGIGAVAAVVLAEVADGAEPDDVGEHVLPAERHGPQILSLREVDRLVGTRRRAGGAVEADAGRCHRAASPPNGRQGHGADDRSELHGRGDGSHRRSVVDEEFILARVPGSRLVCEMRSRGTKNGGRACPPPASAATAGAYCMPPAALSYVKILFEPLVEVEVPEKVGLVPVPAFMLILTVSESWKPGRSVSQAALAQPL